MSEDRGMRSASTETAGTFPAAARRGDLDRLRTVLVLAAFPAFCAQAIVGAVTGGGSASWVATLAREAGAWLLPLFLVVSGASARHSLARNGTAGFLVARVLRLFVPLAAAALVVGGLSAAGVPVEDALTGKRAWFPWYLGGVFALSFLLPPLRLLAGTRPGSRLLSGLSAAARIPGLLVLLGAPAAAAAAIPALGGVPRILSADGGGAVFHAGVFLLGFVLHGEQRLLQQAIRYRGVSLACAVVLAAAAVVGGCLVSATGSLVAALRGAASWCLCLSALGFAAGRFAAARPVPPALREAALPFSVLGRPVAGLLAAASAGWALPAGPRLGLLAAAAFCIVAVLYAAVRRVTVARFCFGLSPLEKQGGSS